MLGHHSRNICSSCEFLLQVSVASRSEGHQHVQKAKELPVVSLLALLHKILKEIRTTCVLGFFYQELRFLILKTH